MSASNSPCPLCECHVWTHAPGKSYIEYEGANYHAECLEVETDHPLVTSDRLRTSEESASPFSK